MPAGFRNNPLNRIDHQAIRPDPRRRPHRCQPPPHGQASIRELLDPDHERAAAPGG
jgi:hypothetical protein